MGGIPLRRRPSGRAFRRCRHLGDGGIRKPAPEIYEIGARSLHLQPKECVFVDDLRGNLKPARALGMTTVHHVDASTTIAQLSEIFGVDLR